MRITFLLGSCLVFVLLGAVVSYAHLEEDIDADVTESAVPSQQPTSMRSIQNSAPSSSLVSTDLFCLRSVAMNRKWHVVYGARV